MGNIPRPILIGVTVGLALIALAGFVLGFSQTARRGVADEEEAAVAASGASSLAVRDATPLVEPAEIAPPKPKAAETAASDAAAAAPEAAPVPAKPAPAPPPVAVPSEAAPGAPTPPPQSPPAKLGDLPPT
jgi:hypothetical protein